jgi:hypothetical protein
MDSINTLRAILVAGAAVAAVIAAFEGVWLATAVLAIGVAGHLLFWVYLHRRPPLPRSPETPL